MERATDLEFLKWFFSNADFGPADGDVKYILAQDFVESTGKALPEGYKYLLEDEEIEYGDLD